MQTQNAKRIQNFIIPSTSMGDIAVLLLRGGNIDKMMNVVLLWTNLPHLMQGNVTIERINEMFEVCLAQAHTPAIFVSIHSSHQTSIYLIHDVIVPYFQAIIEYVISAGLPGAGDMAKKLHETVPLTSTQKDILINLVGDILDLPLSDKQQSSTSSEPQISQQL